MKRPTDKQRLDWVQRRKEDILCSVGKAGRVYWWVRDGWTEGTLRRAIDAAMRQERRK